VLAVHPVRREESALEARRARVEELLDPLAGGQATVSVLPLDPLRSAPLLEPRNLPEERLPSREESLVGGTRR